MQSAGSCPWLSLLSFWHHTGQTSLCALGDGGEIESNDFLQRKNALTKLYLEMTA